MVTNNILLYIYYVHLDDTNFTVLSFSYPATTCIRRVANESKFSVISRIYWCQNRRKLDDITTDKMHGPMWHRWEFITTLLAVNFHRGIDITY